MASKKLNWLLILQGWTMLWVVIGHSPLDDINQSMPVYVQILYDFAYSFHMPLFMLISGYLFYLTRLSRDDWGYKTTIYEKLKRLGIPFLVFTFVAMVMKTIFSGDMSRPAEISLSYFAWSCLYPALGPLNEMWFIMSLMGMFVLFPVWRKILSDQNSEFIVLAILVCLHFVPFHIDFLCLSKVTSHLLWFYTGVLTCKYHIVNRLAAAKWGGVILGVMIALIGYFTLAEIRTLGIIIFSFSLAMIADRHLPSLFFSFRKYTYQIFLMGIFAQIVVKMLAKRIDAPYIMWYVVCVLAGLYVPIAVSLIMKKINFKPLLMCIGLK